MKVFFATNRDLKVNSRGVIEGINSDKPWHDINLNAFRIGTAQVRIEKEKQVMGETLNDKAVYKSARLARERFNRTKGIYTKRGSEEIFPQLIEAIRNNEDRKKGIRCSALVFIHGYDNSFEESIERGAQLAHLYSSDDHRLIPFVFSWPSDGEFGNIPYWNDRKDAESSGGAGARFLACFLTFLMEQHQQNNSSLSSAFLFTHSMGAYLLCHAVQNLQNIPCQVSRIFNAAILTAPEVDIDALENASKLLPLNKLTKEVVVYVNKNDQALQAAENLHNAKNPGRKNRRMGLNGPGANAFTKLAKQGVPLTTVRCYKVDFDHMDRNEFGGEHWYYRRSITVIKDIKSVLSGKDPYDIDFREKVTPTGPDIYRYSLEPPDKYLSRPGTEEPPDEEEN